MSDDVHASDLTLFKLDILTILAEKERYGLAIKRALEEYRGEEVNRRPTISEPPTTSSTTASSRRASWTSAPTSTRSPTTVANCCRPASTG